MVQRDHQRVNRLNAVPVKDVQIESGFWAERQSNNRDRTIPAIYHQMQKTGRLDAWRPGWQPGPGQPKPHIFWDSDAGKWIESVGFSLTTHPNPLFEQQVDEAVELIKQAQQSDGYLNMFFTRYEPENKWKNLRDWHELYDAGHLIEGAVAYYNATGKRDLLDVLIRYTDYIDQQFGPNEGQMRGYCGHPEIELALVKLYETTGEERYLNLSKYFVDERGQEPHYFDIEARERGDDPTKFWAKDYRYCQAHVPVRDQHSATGHSVRAAYLYSGVADLVAETSDEELLKASRDIWEDLTSHQMYITGGLGPAHTNEGFTFAYDLPNETAYAETCASIALVFWASRMFRVDPDSRYIDVMERALYNGVMSGVSYEGSHFFYANPLASYPQVNPFERWSGIHTDQHYRRSEWFDCACCPPNLARLVASINEYFYTTSADTLFVHLYNQNQANIQVGDRTIQLSQQTHYPWDGEVQLTLTVDEPTQFELALRIPDWCHDYHIKLNDVAIDADVVKGYARLNRTWNSGDVVTLSLAMPVERVMPHPNIRQDAGHIALQRGPVVYCLEEVDNGGQLANVTIPADAKLTPSFDTELFGGVGVITGEAVRVEPTNWRGGLYQPESQTQKTRSIFEFRAIPYCFWANREPGEMRVWVREA